MPARAPRLLTKDEAAQKIVDRKMEDFQPSQSMMDTLDILTEELKNTETTPVSTMAEEEMTGTTEEVPVQETAPYTPSDTLPAEVLNELTAQAEALQVAYPNAIGWLYLPDTGINYPIMQGEDNDFYLYHAPDGRGTRAGEMLPYSLRSSGNKKLLPTFAEGIGRQIDSGGSPLLRCSGGQV